MKQRKNKSAFLPPESILFIGEKKCDSVNIRHIQYSQDLFKDEIVDVNKLNSIEINENVNNWVLVTGLHDVDVLEEVGRVFNIHELILADIANTEHSPKYEYMEQDLFIELKLIDKCLHDNCELTSEQISLVLSNNFLLTFLERPSNVIDPIIQRLAQNKVKRQNHSHAFLLYLIIDSIVDSYYSVLEYIGEQIDLIEDSVVVKPDSKNVEKLHKLKRNLIFLRKAIWPLREIVHKLQNDEDLFDLKKERIYINDLYDHVIQIIDTIETQREIVAEILDLYLSSVSQKLNNIMKVLTILSTIFMPLTFLSSIYGMNFRHMPELEWVYGYPMVWSVNIILIIVMVWFFKKKDWF
jgi:magnesium transporter